MTGKPIAINTQWVAIGGVVVSMVVQAVVIGMFVEGLKKDVEFLKERPDVIERITRMESDVDHMKSDMQRLWNRSGAPRSAAAPPQ